MGQRLEGIPGFGIDRVAEAAGSDPEVLRLENYDADIPPHPDAVEATRAAIGRDEANSYLPFSGLDEMKEAVAELIARRGGPRYDPYREIVITDGDGSAVLNALLVLTDPGDEVVLTDPTYAGMLQRVRLVGAVPRLVPLRGDASGWRLDLEALQAAVSDQTRVLFLMNPAIPSGWVANEEEWAAITAICRERDITLLYWMLWEAIVFGGRPIVVPSALEGMRDLTVTAGAVSLEQRMIAWRVGWTVSRSELAPTLAMVHIYNGVVTSGFGQIGAAAALRIGDGDVRAAVAEWERRHEELVRQCDGLPLVPAHGGWSALFDAEASGLDASELSRRLLEQKGRRDPDDRRLGRSRREQVRTARVQQRARGAACSTRRAIARGTRLKNCARRPYWTSPDLDLLRVVAPNPATPSKCLSCEQPCDRDARAASSVERLLTGAGDVLHRFRPEHHLWTG